MMTRSFTQRRVQQAQTTGLKLGLPAARAGSVQDQRLQLWDELQKLKVHERWGMFIALATFLFGVGYSALSIGTTIVHNKNEDMHKRVEQAPELFLRDMVARAEPSHYTRFEYAFGNSGKTTASNVLMHAQTLAVPRPHGATDDQYESFARQQLEAKPLQSWPYPDVVGGMQHTGHWEDDTKISAAGFRAMLKDDLRVYTWGYLSYPVPGLEPRLSPFCAYTTFDEGTRMTGIFSVGTCHVQVPLVP